MKHPYIYLDKADYDILRPKLIKRFKDLYSEYSNLELSLQDDILLTKTNSPCQTSAVITKSKTMLKRAARIIGVSRLSINCQGTSVFTYQIDSYPLQSKNGQIEALHMNQAVLERQSPAAEQDKPADQLLSVEEITTKTEISGQEFNAFLEEANIRMFSLKGEQLLPSSSVKSAIQKFFNWQAVNKTQFALSALNMLADSSEGSESTDSKLNPRQENNSSVEKNKTNKVYRLPSGLKPKSSYDKTLLAALEGLKNKGADCLKAIQDSDKSGLNFVKRLAQIHPNAAKAEKGLIEAAKTLSLSQLKESESETA